MALKLTAPIEKEFKLEKTDEVFGCEGDEPTRVSIRQATQAQHERRQSLWDELVQEVVGEIEAPDAIRLIQKINLAELKRMEVFLTLTACNIQDEAGKDLFSFKDGALAMSENGFKNAWGKLPPLVADEIHEKVREVNISWKPQGEAS